MCLSKFKKDERSSIVKRIDFRRLGHASVRAIALTLAFFVIAQQSASAQVVQRDNFGKEFYAAYGPNLGGEQGFEDTLTVMDLYITSHVVASGTVEIPALNFFRTFTTVPGQITTIHLPNGNFNTQTVELQDQDDEQVISGMAVHVTSDSEVAIFGLNHKEYSSDAFMGFPITTLGTEYLAMCYNSSPIGGGGSNTPGEFWIVAVIDSTHVTITPAASTENGSPAKKAFTVLLQTGDIYMVQGNGNDQSNDLTGSLIESDEPVAVFSGHKRTQMPENAMNSGGHSTSRDHLVEQLPPVSAWGDSALVVPYATSVLPDLVRIVCAEDSTEISVNGTPVMNGGSNKFNAGDFYEITQLNGVTSIQATSPIEVGQYMHTSYGNLGGNPPPSAYGDPALALVFPVEQFETSYTIVSIVNADAFTGNFVNIVADKADVNAMTIDGALISQSEFHPIPGSRFWYAQHTVAQGTHNMSAPDPFGVTIYGLGPVDSYSYTGGTLLKTITPLETSVGTIIDFGDRVLTATEIKPANSYDSANGGTFDTLVSIKNVSEDTVHIFGFPKRIQDTDRFFVIAPSTPSTIPPGGTAQMEIEFWPHEINRRMHTQITASTDHLRAYVVDVYGRGVMDNMGVYRDSNKVHKIDTIDFGTFAKTDFPGDSEVYVGNAGTTQLQLLSAQVQSNAAFTNTGITYSGATVSLPYTIGESPSQPARIGLQFSPSTLGNGTYVDSLVISSQSSTDTVILIAHIETITALSTSVDSIAYGTTLVCDDSNYNIPIFNPNNLPITLTSANIIGTNATDFALSTRTPLVIPAGDTEMVQVQFSPTGRGTKNAQVLLQFDKPRTAKTDTVQLFGTGDKLTLEFAGDVNVHAYSTDNFLVPIYAVTDLTPFAPTGYEIVMNYDTVNLQLINIITNNTLTPSGGYQLLFNSNPPGHDTVLFQQGGGDGGGSAQPIVGGGCSPPIPVGDTCEPLIYLQFRTLLHGADPQTFEKAFPICFNITLDNSLISSACADRIFDCGNVQIVSVCDTQFLLQQGTIPSGTMLEPPFPNPSGATMTMKYDVGTEIAAPTAQVKIDVEDVYGNIVAVLVDQDTKPGYYNATFDGTALPSGQYFIRMTAGGTTDNPSYRLARRVVIQK